MTTNEPKRPGYRGTLPERDDRLARTWLLIIGAIFVAIIVLSALAIPSRFIPDPTPVPLPTNPPAPTESASPSGSASGSPSESPSTSESPSASPTGG
jgi:cytoskeletal protein RodZ